MSPDRLESVKKFPVRCTGNLSLSKKSFRSDPRVFTHKMRENTLSPRKVFFATYTPPRKMD